MCDLTNTLVKIRITTRLLHLNLERKKKLRVTHSCFRALDRAADSRFLIIRLCRRSPELLSDSGTLFLAEDGKAEEEAKASNGLLKEETLELGWDCKCELGLISGSELSRK